MRGHLPWPQHSVIHDQVDRWHGQQGECRGQGKHHDLRACRLPSLSKISSVPALARSSASALSAATSASVTSSSSLVQVSGAAIVTVATASSLLFLRYHRSVLIVTAIAPVNTATATAASTAVMIVVIIT